MRGARTRIAGIPLGGIGLAAAFALLLTACGSDTNSATSVIAPRPLAEAAEATVTPTTAPPTTATPTTVAATTTTIPDTTTIPETTAAPTTLPATTLPALPVPAGAPTDTRGHEPVVELGSIEIPKIGLAASMFEGIRLTTLDRGPGHWPGTAMPGAVGNVVVAGHRTSHSKPFRHLDQLVPGDEVIFTTPEGRFVYNVAGVEIVNPDAIGIIDQTSDRTATLFACHPAGSTKQRIVVHLALATV